MSTTFIDLDSDVRLRPVVELAPASFGSWPDMGPGPWTTEQSALYWRACLAQSGIIDLNPVLPGCWFVSTGDIAVPFPLNKILEAHLDGTELSADPEELSPFAGGFTLYHDAEPLLLPSCCGDLGNIADWAKAVVQRNDSPEMLWVGHPWLSTWFANGRLHIREEQEYPTATSPRTVRLHPAVLESAIADAERELDQFLDKILLVLHAMPCSVSTDAIARRLVGRSP